MRSFIIHFGMDLKGGLRDKTLLFMNYLFPLGFFLAMGGIMPKINPQYGEILIPSMMIFGILVSSILGMPNVLVTSRNNGIFRSYKINGVSKLSMMAIPTLSTIFHTIIVTAIILLSAPFLFGSELPGNMGGLILVFIATVIAITGIALLIGIIAKNTSVTVLYAQAIFLPSMLIGGLMMPSSALPESISTFGKLLPTTYAMDAYQALVENGQHSFNPFISLGILLSCGVICFILSWYLFKLDNNNTSKSKSKLWALGALIPFILGTIFLK
ncbi:ABC transporter permease [Oceanirhabdus sp. W0125-5]|uniref:ABC transporter permease n=1 Tax=Oceanirhabdus sp. W0125-5 TaxID=2999116 RepID=UPI0022F2DC00|nr:ABC transporter permease [Oceanirhabdus sp. W0125-5]WBW95578.1 ABC transporter permease [Oceanirhabdus sp. W0125-5]